MFAAQPRGRYQDSAREVLHHVIGLSGLPGNREIRLDSGRPQWSIYLTADPNPALAPIDRAHELAHLMAAALVGQRGQGKILALLNERADEQAVGRTRKFGASAVYIVVEATGEATSTPTEVARDLCGALFAFDAIDKSAIRATHQPLVNAALAAVALVVGSTPDIGKVLEGVELTLPDGRPLYSVTISGNRVKLTMARQATDADAPLIEKMIKALRAEERLLTPSRLLVDALRSTDDRLEAFIFAWASLEMLVRKYTSGCESGEWVFAVPEQEQAVATTIHEAFVAEGHQYYSLADKARVFALVHGLGIGDDLAEAVTRIQKQYRAPLYHQGALSEQYLPVESVIQLARKVLEAALNTPPRIPKS